MKNVRLLSLSEQHFSGLCLEWSVMPERKWMGFFSRTEKSTESDVWRKKTEGLGWSNIYIYIAIYQLAMEICVLEWSMLRREEDSVIRKALEC